MSDPIGAAVARFYQSGTEGVGLGGQDTRARQLPVVPESGTSFADTLTGAINGVSAQQTQASETLQAFLRGEDVEMHRVMAATEEASISLEMLIEVRNKFAEAYRTLISMQ